MSLFLGERLVEILVLEVLCPLMRRFFLQEIDFPRLPLVVLLGELRLSLAFFLEDVAFPGGVTGILSIKRAIQLGGTLLAFVTMLVFGLEALFLSWLTVFTGGSKLRPGDVVRGLCTLAVFHECLKICSLRIKTLSNQHGLVRPLLLAGEIFDQFRLVEFLTVLEERWKLSHP